MRAAADFSQSPPASICILRLSALGDIANMVPVIRTLQDCWPQTHITWIIGKLEHRLVGDINGVEFIVFDKARGWRAYHDIRRQLRGRSFAVLLHMQVALRANLLSLLVRSPVRVGYDAARSKDLHGLFVNRRIAANPGQHVVDGFLSFLAAIGLRERRMNWAVPIPDDARRFAEQHIDGARPVLIVSPCSRHPLRNWRAERYAQVIDHAIECHGMQVVLCGGPSPSELEMAQAVVDHAHHDVLNLVGKDTIKRMLALLERADVLISPDSGPAHMASSVGTPVVGLYAASNPRRSGPYLSQDWCVDRYAEAAQHVFGKSPDELPWGTKIERPGVMDLVTAADVIGKLDALMTHRTASLTSTARVSGVANESG